MVDYIQREADAILHKAQKGTHAGTDAATQELHEDRKKMSPAHYNQLLEDIKAGNMRDQKAHPDLPTVFVSSDKVQAWVQPVHEKHK